MAPEASSIRRAILHTLIFTALLVAADYFIRRDELIWAGGRYLLVAPVLFFLLFFLRKFILLFSGSSLSPILIWLFSLLLGLVWGTQYIFYGVYREFLSARDMGVTLSNLDYWLEHGAALLSLSQLWPIPVYTLLFYLYFLFGTRGASRHSTGKISGLILASVLGFVLSFNLVEEVEARQYLTPFLYTVDQARKLMGNRKEYLVSYQRESLPVRDKDDIQAIQRRGDFNVLFILHESLRADHTSLFGYKRDTTPNQKARLSNAWLYPYAISNSGVTRNSCHSIFTGLQPTEDQDMFSSSLIWQYAKAANLDTFYISSHWLEWESMDALLLDQRFVDYVNAPLHADPTLGRDDMATVSAFENWLKDKYNNQPFFGVLHYSGTHYPYLAGQKQPIWQPASASFNPDKVPETINEYDNAIHYLDIAVESALRALDKAGLAENTIIISSSDHAEAFYEHKQFFHGKVFWQEGYNVPFFIYIPEKLKSLFSDAELQALTDSQQRVVSNVDIFPTLLDIFNAAPAKQISGHSLLRPYPESFTAARVEAGGYIAIENRSRLKYVVNNKDHWLARVDLKADPLEKTPEYTRIKKKMSLAELLATASHDNPVKTK